MSIYSRINDLAKSKNISIRQIEMHFGFANGSMRKWDDNANPDRLKKVADYLGTTTAYLRGELKQQPETPPAKVDLTKSNIFSYQGEQIDADGIDPEDWEIIKAVLARAKKDRKERE